MSKGITPSTTVNLCAEEAEKCRLLAQKATVESVQIMLEHIAGTWERIAERLKES